MVYDAWLVPACDAERPLRKNARMTDRPPNAITPWIPRSLLEDRRVDPVECCRRYSEPGAQRFHGRLRAGNVVAAGTLPGRSRPAGSGISVGLCVQPAGRQPFDYISQVCGAVQVTVDSTD